MERVRQELVWNAGFATGVGEIDEQHLILVHTINEASAKLASECPADQLGQVTQDLLAYALYHLPRGALGSRSRSIAGTRSAGSPKAAALGAPERSRLLHSRTNASGT